MKDLISTLGSAPASLIMSFVHAFAGVNFEKASSELIADEARFARKHRVTVVMPKSSSEVSWVVYSRVASDAALMELHRADATDFDAFDLANSGEVLNLLVDPGYHRIHAVAVPRRRRTMRELMVAVPRDPENAALLFEGDVYSDVGLA